MRSGRKMTHGLLMASLAVTVVGGGAFWSTAAHAQLIGPCPSPLMPPPCIVFDYKKLADMAREHAQQVERLQDMVKTVQETKATADSISGAIDGVMSLQGAGINVAPGEGETFSEMASGGFSQTVQSFGARLYDEPGGGTDSLKQTAARRNDEAVSANVDALAMSLQAREYAKGSEKRMFCLSKAANTSQDLRGDWAINSQMRLELLRQQTQRDQLFSVYLQNVSVQKALSAPIEQGENVRLGRTNDAPAVPARSPAWGMQDRLEDIEAMIRSTLLALNIAQGVETVREDAQAVQDRYENAETRREQALNNFRNRARSWDSRRANYIVDTTISELNRIDTQLAALRERPIGQLSGAFRDRNIDAAAMMENDVDPRQFIGTWGDPLKNKITLDMANSLLDGRLDNYIDGDDDNDEYRDLLLAYNEARLEEAWMRNYASEASDVADQVNAIAAEESESAGYTLSPEAARQKLQELIAEANQLGQQIQQTGEEVPTNQAAAVLQNINNLLNGQPAEAPSSPGTTPNSVPNPSPSPTIPPDLERDPRDPRNPLGPPPPQQ